MDTSYDGGCWRYRRPCLYQQNVQLGINLCRLLSNDWYGRRFNNWQSNCESQRVRTAGGRMTEFPIERRTLLRTTGAGVFGTGVGTGIAGAVEGPDVGTERADAVKGTSGGDVTWEFETGEWVSSSPTVVGGTVYVGSADEHVYAIDNGNKIWEFETNDRVFSSPTVVDGTVFVGEGHWSTRSEAAEAESDDSMYGPSSVGKTDDIVADQTPRAIYAIDADTGEKQWEFMTQDSVQGSPTVADGTVYVGSFDSKIYALDADSGTKQWEFETSGSVRSSPTVIDGTLFIGNDDGNVYALDAETGDVEWTYESGGGIIQGPTVWEETVFVGSKDNSVYALDAETGDVKWTYETGDSVYSSATVWGGGVFVGSDDGNVYALDTETGEEIWTYDTGYEVESSPTVADGTVFAATHADDNNDNFGEVHALNAATGEEAWTYSTSGWFISSPTVVSGTVFIGCSDHSVYALDAGVTGASEGSRVNLGTLGHHYGWDGRDSGDASPPVDQGWEFGTGEAVYSSPTLVDGTLFVGSGDGYVYALDAGTGDVVWTHQTGQAVFSSPTVVDGTVFVGSADNSVYAFDTETGNVEWTHQTEGWIWSSPTVMDGTVFIGSNDDKVYALDAETGDVEWTQEIGDQWVSSPTVVDGTVFIPSYRDGIYALDTDTGDIEWSHETGDSSYLHSSPTVVDGSVFVGGPDGNVRALDTDTGDIEWTHQTGDSVSSSPTVANGVVFVGSYDESVYALDAETGDIKWTHEIGGTVLSSPTVVDGTVFVGSGDFRMYALDAETGTEQWRFQTYGRVHSSPTVVDGTVFVGSYGGSVYALDTDVEGSSEGSRVLLRTLGHHDENIGQPPDINLELDASTALPQGVAPGGVEKISLSVTNTSSSSLTDIEFGLDPESIPDGWTVDDHIEFAGENPQFEKILNSWDNSAATWTIDELDPGETLSAAVTVETADSASAGTQESITVRTGTDSPNDFTSEVTVSLVTRFDPSVHELGFSNWSSGYNTYPTHDHSSISQDEVSQAVTDSFIPDLEDGDTPVPDFAATLLTAVLYPLINSQAATNGHCYGMTYASQEYYNSGVPVTGVPTANDILTPGVDGDVVGSDIDFYHNTQVLDTDAVTPLLMLCVFDIAPDDYEAVLNDIQDMIEDQGTAPLSLSESGEEVGHQVLAYDVTDSAAGQTEVHVYDPSSPFELTKDDSVYDLWTYQLQRHIIAELGIDDGLCVRDTDVFYFRSGDRIKQYNPSADSVTDLFAAPDGSRNALAYGEGSLWFADATEGNYDGRIVELNPSTGEQRSEINLGVDITGLAFGNGSLWATDVTLNEVREFTPDGNQVDSFDVGGPADTTGPHGLAYANNTLFLGEGNNNSVHEFGLDGSYNGELDLPDRQYNSLAATGAELLGTNADGDLIHLQDLGQPSENPLSVLDYEYTTSITFDTTGTKTTIESPYRAVEYDQVLPLKDGGDVDNPIEAFGTLLAGNLFALIVEELAGLVTFEFTLSSPGEESGTAATQGTTPSAEVTVTDPAGDSLFSLEAESGVDRSDLEFDAFRYRAGADTGQYGVTIDADEPVEYTVKAVGEVEDAGSIEATQSETISAGEGQAFLQATVPDNPDESGELIPGIPSLPGYENPPQDLDSDGRFEDVDGDGEFDIFDVQALFDGLDSDTVQNNPAAFNFNDDENPQEVTIFDVQGLFERLSGD
jgi:outer membrane protein assembly factor BamB